MEQSRTANQTSTGDKRRDIHQEVTDIIIKQLEAGATPWHKPWASGNSEPFQLPLNSTSGKTYQGVNILLLWGASMQHEYSSNEWATFKQWQEKEETICKGEKGTPIIYYNTFEKEVDGELKDVPFIKASYVFNRCQLTSYTPEADKRPERENLVKRLDTVERFVANTQAVVKHLGNKAYFVPARDEIYMPPQSRFVDTASSTATENYYSVLAHELVHWSGHSKRLDRKFGKRFGDVTYAEEELVAELGAAFLCAELEITNTPRTDHASYLAHWLNVLKQNKYAIFSAASLASKAVSYLQELQP